MDRHDLLITGLVIVIETISLANRLLNLLAVDLDHRHHGVHRLGGFGLVWTRDQVN